MSLRKNETHRVVNNNGENVKTSERQGDTGMLAVQVFTADRAIPIEGANVIISRAFPDGKEELLHIFKTDASGTTPTVNLPAPPKANSLAPENGTKFYTYNIRADKQGYYTVENMNVPVFAGNKSIQPVALLPLPDGEERGKRIVFSEEEPEELE